MANSLTVVAAIGAGVAIVQPWVIGLWKRWIRSGSIEIYVTGFLEVGYSEFGPTLAVDGTFRAIHRDMFVERVNVRLTKNRDKSEHSFEWIAFRSHRVPIGGTSEFRGFLEAASGFMVSPNSPHRVCIVLSDASTRESMQEQLTVVNGKFWELRRSQQFSVLDQRLLLEDEQKLEMMLRLAEAYRSDSTHVDAFGALNRICYWEGGKYDVELTVMTARPNRRFSNKWGIELSDENARQLRLNVIAMIDRPLYIDAGLQSPPCFFAYVPYRSER